MKRRIFLLTLTLILFFSFGQKTYADPLVTAPATRDNLKTELLTFSPATSKKIVVINGKVVIAPVAALWLIGEGIAWYEVAFGTGVVVVAGVATYKGMTEAEENVTIDWDAYVVNETPLPGFPGGPTPPNLFNNGIIKIIQLAISGEVGYLIVKKIAGGKAVSVEDQLLKMYEDNPGFRKQVDALQNKIKKGGPFCQPVSTPNGTRYRIFLPLTSWGLKGTYEVYDPISESWSRITEGSNIPGPSAFVGEMGEKLGKSLVRSFAPDGSPQSDEWQNGICKVVNSFTKIQNGTATSSDYSKIQDFMSGNCLGEPDCLSWQKYFTKYFVKHPIVASEQNGQANSLTESDKDFLRNVELDPGLLDTTANLERFILILESLPEDGEKDRLKRILCHKIPWLSLCNGGSTAVTSSSAEVKTRKVLEKPQSSLAGSEQEAEEVSESDEESFGANVDKVIEIVEDQDATNALGSNDPDLLEEMRSVALESNKLNEDYNSKKIKAEEYVEEVNSLDTVASLLLQRYSKLQEASDETASQSSAQADADTASVKAKRTGNYKGGAPGRKWKKKNPTEFPTTETATETVVESETETASEPEGDQTVEETSVVASNTDFAYQALEQIVRVADEKTEVLGNRYLAEQISEAEYDSTYNVIEAEADYLVEQLVEFTRDTTTASQNEASELVKRFREFVKAEPVATENDTMVTLPKNVRNPNDNNPELAQMMSEMRDCQTEVEKIWELFTSGQITKLERDKRLVEFENKGAKLLRKFRKYVKENYDLPGNVWWNSNTNNFNSAWSDRVLRWLNGSTTKPVFKRSVQIYKEFYQKFRKIMEDSDLWHIGGN